MLAITNTSSVQANDDINIHQSGLGDIACAAFLLCAGSWLAHKQLPRLAGQLIEYDAPVFTKIGASILFSIGITGGIIGGYQLAYNIRKKLNEL